MSAGDLPKKGDVIAGKFQVEDVLGAGGMGVVIAARHLILRQRVAVKFLLPQAARLPEASARFVREARAAVAIQSEHVARVLDVGTLETGAPYMVMEFLAGTDFAKLLKQSGALPIADAIDYLLQAGEAIAEAHAHGIFHRDLKPGNLFLTRHAEGSPLVKVLDFGLSKIVAGDDGASEGSLTATGFVAGSPFYMAPEQVRSLKDVDWRADVWALGTILYEMLTGKRAFDAPTLTAVCASIIADTPRPMRAIRPEIPEALEAAVMRCLEKDPARRTRSVAELAEGIAAFAPARSVGSVEKILRLQPGMKTVPLAEVEADAAETLVMPGAAAMAEGAAAPPVAAVTEVLVEAAERRDAEQPAATSNTGQATAWGQTQGSAKRPAFGWVVGVAGAAVVLAGLAALWLMRGSEKGTAESAQAATTSAPTATAIATVTSAAATTASEVPPPAPPSAAPPAASAMPSAAASAVAAQPPQTTAGSARTADAPAVTQVPPQKTKPLRPKPAKAPTNPWDVEK